MGRRGKKRANSGVQLLIDAALALIVFLVIIFLVRKVPGWIGSSSSCEENAGQCVDGVVGCGSGYYREFSLNCKDNGNICCKSETIAEGEMTRFKQSERTALANPVWITIGKDPKQLSSLDLIEGESYDITVNFNDKLPPNFDWFFIYLTSAVEPGKIYYLDGTGKIVEFEGETGKELWQKVMFNKGVTDKFQYKLPPQAKFKATLRDSYGKYKVNVVLFDTAKLVCKLNPPDPAKSYEECLKNEFSVLFNRFSGAKDKFDNSGPEAQIGIMSDKSYYLGSKSFPLNIKRILDISGVSATWAAEDTFTLTTNNKDYAKNVSIRLIDATDKQFSDVLDECAQSSNKFRTEVSNVIGTTLETSGLPLNINIGGFRLPASSTQRKYVISSKKIEMANGKAEIKIDRATMINDFYGSLEEAERASQVSLVAGQNTFICAKAEKDGTSIAYTVSDNPIRIDVVEPYVDENTVRVVYPDPVINTPDMTSQFPSMAGQNYFYQQYPRVIVTCQDYGQSGCASYDYFLKTGNFVNLQVASDDLKDGLTGIALQFGLNKLMGYFATRNPYETLCPPVYSAAEFRRNTNPVINLRVKGEGFICVRIVDKAGNAAIIFKEIWTPQELIDKVASEVLGTE